MFSSILQSIGLQEVDEEKKKELEYLPDEYGIAPTDTYTTDRRDDDDDDDSSSSKEEEEDQEVVKIFTVTAQPHVTKLGIHIIKHGIVQKVNPTSIFSSELKELDQILDVNGINLTAKNSQQILETMQSFNSSTNKCSKTFTVLRKPKRFKISTTKTKSRHNHNRRAALAVAAEQQQQQHEQGDTPSVPSDSPPSFITIRTNDSNSNTSYTTKVNNTSPNRQQQQHQQQVINSREIMEANTTMMKRAKMNSKANRINMLGEIEYLDNDGDEDHTMQTFELEDNNTSSPAGDQIILMGDICFNDNDTHTDIEAAAASSPKRQKKKRNNNNNKNNNEVVAAAAAGIDDQKQYHCVVSGLCLATIGLVLSLIAIVVVFFVVGVFDSNNNNNNNNAIDQTSTASLQENSHIIRQNDFGD